MLSLVCILIILLHASQGNSESSELPICPTWTYPMPPHNKCICGASLGGFIACDKDTLTSVIIVRNICIFFSEEEQTTFAGTSPYCNRGKLPRNVSKIKEDSTRLCFHLHRTGQLCGECEENYTLPAYSYYLGCIKCESYKNGWVKFIAAALVPVTLFYVIVITFRISVTSSALNAFVMINQILAIPPVIRQIYSSNMVYYGKYASTQFSNDFIIAISALWNLDFRSFYGPIKFCLYRNLNYQQVLLSEYAIGIFPLFLILLTYIMVKLHDNFAIVVWLWRPFHKCLAVFRRHWNIQSNLVHASATFIVLSYVKILNTSFEFLIPSRIFNIQNQKVNKVFWYYNGSVDMTSKDYLPYLMLALFMLLIFNILPLLLLALYPFKVFQRFLDCCLSQNCKLTLKIYMDTFHGCYEDTPHDYRHFAALYLALRFFNLLAISIFNYKLYPTIAMLVLVFTLALVAKFQPYKCKRSNRVDIVLLLLLITGYTSSAMHYIEVILYPKWLHGVICGIAGAIFECYFLYLILAGVFLKIALWFKRIKQLFLLRRIKSREVIVENQALLSHGNADYGSCQ